jgi:MarR family transcriptional regulator, organic hydroperoxide resistance regulator
MYRYCMAEPKGSDPLAEEISSLFNRASFRLKDHQFACLERFKLSAIQANALWRIGPRESLSVSALADRFWADPSNLAAPLVALEKRGLVTRRPASHDRRVRTVRLTAEGRALRARLMACLFTEPPVVTGLTTRERRQFRDLLAKLDLQL